MNSLAIIHAAKNVDSEQPHCRPVQSACFDRDDTLGANSSFTHMKRTFRVCFLFITPTTCALAVFTHVLFFFFFVCVCICAWYCVVIKYDRGSRKREGTEVGYRVPAVMLEFFIKPTRPRPRIVCRNEETYTLFWPYLFSRVMPGARPMCRWAARRGAAVHGALRLQMDETLSCHLVVTRPVEPRRPLISLPLHLGMTTQMDLDARKAAMGQWTTVEELAALVARELHNRRSAHRPYLEFLHDLHNQDNDEVFGDVSSTGSSFSVSQMVQQQERLRLREEVDQMYGGNAMSARGVANAPFLSKASLQTSEQRVMWVRTQDMLRRLEQSVPYFAAKSTAWAVSMVLARSIQDDEGGRSLYPLIDFCAHSFEPNTYLVVCDERHRNESMGVPFHDASSPCVHLVTSKHLKEGDVITRCFSPRRVNSNADREWWQMTHGFLPRL